MKLRFFVLLFLFACSNDSVDNPEVTHEVDTDIVKIDEVIDSINKEVTTELKEEIEPLDDKGCQENNGVWDKQSLYTCYKGPDETSLQLICEDSKMIVVMSAPVEGIKDSWEVGKFDFLGIENQIYHYIFGSEKSPTAKIEIDVTNKEAVKLHFTEFDYAGSIDYEGDYKECSGE